MKNEELLKKIQVVETKRFTAQVWVNDSGRLVIEVGCKDGGSVNSIGLRDLDSPEIEAEFSTTVLEKSQQLR